MNPAPLPACAGEASDPTGDAPIADLEDLLRDSMPNTALSQTSGDAPSALELIRQAAARPDCDVPFARFADVGSI
jgi:hypothetical protein